MAVERPEQTPPDEPRLAAPAPDEAGAQAEGAPSAGRARAVHARNANARAQDERTPAEEAQGAQPTPAEEAQGAQPTPAEEAEGAQPTPAEDATGAEVEDALSLLFAGKVEQVLPPEELADFYEFIREEALARRRFAVSFRVECGCLAWIGYSLSNIVTFEDGMQFSAKPLQTFVPDHEPDVEHPEGPTEDPPQEFADWPIWPFEIYQDELESGSAGRADLDDDLDEALDKLDAGSQDEIATITERAALEDPLQDREDDG